MTAVRWEKIIYLAVGLVIVGSVLFFVGFLAENRLDTFFLSSHPSSDGGSPIRHVGFAMTVGGNLLLILHILKIVADGRLEIDSAFASVQNAGELVHGFRFTFILLLIIGIVSAILLGGAVFSPALNLYLWLIGLCFPGIIRLVLLPLETRLPRGEIKDMLKALLVVCWGLLLLQVLISLVSTFPPPLSNIVLSGLLIGLGVVGLWVLYR